jgi:1,2-phenylacetyl-CoA epoxidase catalytic subunit
MDRTIIYNLEFFDWVVVNWFLTDGVFNHWVWYLKRSVDNSYANILKNIYKKVKKIVGIG